MVLLCYKILNKAGRCRSSDVRRHFYGKEDFSAPRCSFAREIVLPVIPGSPPGLSESRSS